MKKILLLLLVLFNLSFSSAINTDYKVLNHKYNLYAYGDTTCLDLMEPDRALRGITAYYYKKDIPYRKIATADRYKLWEISEHPIADSKSDILYKYINHKLYIKVTNNENNKCIMKNIKYIEIIEYRNAF